MKAFLLMVTWWTAHYAHSYQVEFSTEAKCRAAKEALIIDYAKTNDGSGAMLSAICVDR
jgi:hypothetical protein